MYYEWLRSLSLTCEDNSLVERPWPSDSLSLLARNPSPHKPVQ